MGSDQSRFIRSMFVRRLLLIGGAVAVGLVALGVQAARLSIDQHADHLAEAERRLRTERWTPTTRGAILDRRGRILAQDVPAFDVMVEYDAITGDWAYTEAARRARVNHTELWTSIEPHRRDALIQPYLSETERELDAMWDAIAQSSRVPREDIDARRRSIEATVERMANAVWNHRLRERRAALNRDRQRTIEVTLQDVAQPLREQQMPHAVVSGIDERIAFEVRRIADQHPMVSLHSSASRAYPRERMTVVIDRSGFPPLLRDQLGDASESITVDGVATHIIGWMRSLQREDVLARPRINPETGTIDRGHYRPGDLVGSVGVESASEFQLRGDRGYIITQRDTREQQVTEPIPGQDVELTIDIELQARIQALLSPESGLAVVQPWHETRQGLPAPLGTPFNTSAVVLDIPTGEILSMVSMPSFNRAQLQDDPRSIFEDPVNSPWVNRAISRPYMPGSIVKPVILAAAVTEGLHRLDEPIVSGPYLFPDRPNQFRSWIYKQYGTTFNDMFGRPLYADDALCVSCNIYFYTLGMKLGPQRISEWYRRFGVGTPYDLGIGHEYPGNAGVKHSGERLYLGDAILMGIGQGPIAITPLHAADFYATLARGGQRIIPRLFRHAPPHATDLRLDPESVDVAIKGLERAVKDEWGTGRHITYPGGRRVLIFNVPGVDVVGKTGTATASPIVATETDDAGNTTTRVLRSGDHAWFVLLVGREGQAPRYAISVVVEFAGSGGRVAGPIANEIIRALVTEGYL
ncbi:MAG: hypothetical protein EA380_02160 [Phycisphaeraceae bacterium]|nr:MAG: hypothetical protein EA380_02160 [Phycisphaeraceae bacterium]